MRILQKRIFFSSGMHQIASSRMCSCTVRTQVFLSRAPPPVPAHRNTYYSHAHTNLCKREWKVLFYGCWLVQALGSGYTCSFLQFPLSSCTYPTTVSHSLPPQWRQSHCRFLSYGALPIANIDQTAVWQHWRQYMLISKWGKNVVERIPAWIWQHTEIFCHSQRKWGYS